MASGQKITKRALEALRPDGQGDMFLWDTEVTGFGARMKPSGSKSFVFRYRAPGGGNDRKVTIGRFPSLSVDSARDQARELYAQRAKGGDPAMDRQRARAAKTVRELITYYLGEHATLKGNRDVTLVEYRRALSKHVLPKWGARKLDQVSRADISNLLHSLAATPVSANRLRAVLSGMFAVAVRLGWATVNPCKGSTPYRERARQRFLKPEEQAIVVSYLALQPNQTAADVVRLLMLTGARRGEVLGAKWDMFDLKAGVWVKPSHHTKQGREQVLSLPKAANDLLLRRQFADSASAEFVFPRRSDSALPLSGIKKFWLKLTSDLEMDGLRLHDLRHTSASILISAGHSVAEVGRVLGHTQSRTTERYTHLFDENQKRSAETLNGAFSAAASTAGRTPLARS